jgi:uroporphyrin-III C-methyltransferase/precorrin-2 dehydrogenase/sirohydrochlorin ferrochelatase
MDALPLSWPLAGRRVVLFGAGPLARRKLALLRKTEARIEIYPVSQAARPDGDGGGESRPHPPTDSRQNDSNPTSSGLHVHPSAAWPAGAELNGAAFVIVALEDAADAERAAGLARAAGVPVNVVDRPELSDFHIPAIIDRGEVTIAVATGGTAPALARDVRAAIEAAVPASTQALAGFAKAIRGQVRQVRDYDRRRQVWEAILRGPAGERARAGDFEAAERLARAAIAGEERAGVVHIVGAGPGDPELLTLKALRVLQDADVIIYDRLVDPRILDMARRDADRLYVGKARAKHSVPQDQINAMMIAEARAGRRVVRLKGGDPFVFGRGGEELEALREAGVAAHVVPGITAALGCAAAAQVPLTHRDHAQAVTFITGHAQTGGAPNLDWRALAGANHTVVVYMGAANAGEVSRRLIEAGREAATPALIVENGAREDQRLIRSRLEALAVDVARLDLKSPSLLIIGEVAALANAEDASRYWRAAAEAA